MKSSAKKVKLASVDDLFSTEESRQDAALEKVQHIALSELHPFPDHPFSVKDDDSMKETVESIKERGVLQPICGGTGYGPGPNLPDAIEHSRPDYSLYPQFPDTAYGFLSRGCPRGCAFCIVSGKEGRQSHQVADLSEFWDGQREIKLLDANLLACPDHERLILQLAESRAYVDFTQGLDIRLITPDNVALLNKVRTKAVHFAWDNPNVDLTADFQRFLDLTNIKNFRRRKVYVLTNYGSTHEQDLYRVYALRRMGYDPYVMVYDRPSAPQITRHLQRWVNNKWVFYSVPDFADYDPSGKKP